MSAAEGDRVSVVLDGVEYLGTVAGLQEPGEGRPRRVRMSWDDGYVPGLPDYLPTLALVEDPVCDHGWHGWIN